MNVSVEDMAATQRGPAPRNALLGGLVLWLWSGLWLGLWLGSSAAAVAQPPENTQRPGTIGFDYRNHPDVSTLALYEYVVLSPRATAAARTLGERGCKVYFWVQPLACTWRGRPLAKRFLHGAAHDLAKRLDAFVPDTSGVVAELVGSDIHGCHVLDFRVPGLAAAMARLVVSRLDGARGLLIDYGCQDLAWEKSLGVDPGIWQAWSDGYHEYRLELRRLRPDWEFLCQCDRSLGWLPEVCDGLVLESVGWSLNPYDKVWSRLLDRSSRTVLLVDDPSGGDDPARRRLTAAMSLLTDALYCYRDLSGGSPVTVHDPEHFELFLGEFDEPLEELVEGVYRRRSSHGLVVANLSERVFVYDRISIAPHDALVAQTRRRHDGRDIPWPWHNTRDR